MNTLASMVPTQKQYVLKSSTAALFRRKFPIGAINSLDGAIFPTLPIPLSSVAQGIGDVKVLIWKQKTEGRSRSWFLACRHFQKWDRLFPQGSPDEDRRSVLESIRQGVVISEEWHRLDPDGV